VLAAIEATLADPATRTRDLGGSADTATVVGALVDRVGGTGG
jgi:tartrate dehydrogenase/decarboxylase/D-malate dehydrogenase